MTTSKINTIFLSLAILLACSCSSRPTAQKSLKGPHLIVLGIAQDAGFPQAGCQKACCQKVWREPDLRRQVTCLGLIDPENGKSWLLEATPDFKYQIEQLANFLPGKKSPLPDAIFLTHAHIGHYSGLIHLGREAIGAKQQAVYTLPRMDSFLRSNGPWDQLVALENILLHPLKAELDVTLSSQLSIRPFLVPHRDEYSETAGFRITGPSKTVLFIPDIDKWEKWEKDIREEIKNVDYAFLDGTFFQNGEIPGRDMSEIPHPFIEESMRLFSDLSLEEKARIYFIHFNHTNPLLQPLKPEKERLIQAGFRLAEQGAIIEL